MSNEQSGMPDRLQCPHCHTAVPKGATVCTGCQAEVEYGTPGTLVVLLLVVALFGGYGVATKLESAIAGWVVGIALLICGGLAFSKLFGYRAKFTREYKT